MAEATRPRPLCDPASAPFYEAARGGRLLLAYCEHCRRYEQPGARTCPVCLGQLGWRQASGRGAVFSFVVFHRALHPAFEVPYAVCMIELEEGPRIVGELIDAAPDAVEVGLPVAAVFAADDNDGLPVRFRPRP